MIPVSIEIATTPSKASVVAALRLFGSLNAGTPLEMASTPVRAADPEEKARASTAMSAKPVSCE